MQSMFTTPWRALYAGLVITLVLLASFVIGYSADWRALLSLVVRYAHVVAGMVWVGLIVFVNFVQLAVVQDGDDADRMVIGKQIAPRVIRWLQRSSDLSLASGVILLFLAEYFSRFDVRAGLLWLGAFGGICMWVFVNKVIWPNMKIASGATPGEDADKARARLKVRNFARANLVLALPVVFAMLAVAHL